MGINRNNKIQILYSDQAGVTPDASQLEYGELAINIADGALYFRDSFDELGTVSGSGNGSGFEGITAQNDGGSDAGVDAENGRVTINTGTGLSNSVAGSVLTINGKDAATTTSSVDGKKGIACFNENDFTASSGFISLADQIVKGITTGQIGGSGVSVLPTDNFISILGGYGITCSRSGTDSIVINRSYTGTGLSRVWQFDGSTNNVNDIEGGNCGLSLTGNWPSVGSGDFYIYVHEDDNSGYPNGEWIRSLQVGDRITFYDFEDPTRDFLVLTLKPPQLGGPPWTEYTTAFGTVYGIYGEVYASSGGGTISQRTKDFFVLEVTQQSNVNYDDDTSRLFRNGEPLNTYGFTGSTPNNNGELYLDSSTDKIYIHKFDTSGKDNRILFGSLSSTDDNILKIHPQPGQRGLTGTYAEYKLGPSGYDGTRYSFDIKDTITYGDGFTVGDQVYIDVQSGTISNYIDSFNGATGAVEGVSSINGLTGGITFNQGDNIILTTGDGGITIDAAVLTGVTGATGATGPQGEQGIQGVTGVTGPGVGYTSGADTPSSANTGDFWLETDTGDLFFYDGSAFVQISGADGVTGATGPQGDQGIQGVTGATGVDGVTGATGPVGDYVESFNGTTGAVEGVSSVNGQTGDVITPNEIVMRFPLWSVLGGLTGSYTARAHKVTQDLQLKTAEIYVPSGLAAGSGENFSISFKKTNTLSDSVANIDSGATTLNLGGIPSNTIGVTPPKSGSNYFSTKTVPDGTTCGDGDYIYVSIVTNTADPFDVEAYLVWETI